MPARTGARAGADPEVFGALADPTRRRLIEWLIEDGPASATELARRLPISRQGVAKHLAAMEAAGLVTSMKEGRDVRFRLRPEPLAGAMEWMAALAARWDERLEALAGLLLRPQAAGASQDQENMAWPASKPPPARA